MPNSTTDNTSPQTNGERKSSNAMFNKIAQLGAVVYSSSRILIYLAGRYKFVLGSSTQVTYKSDELLYNNTKCIVSDVSLKSVHAHIKPLINACENKTIKTDFGRFL